MSYTQINQMILLNILTFLCERQICKRLKSRAVGPVNNSMFCKGQMKRHPYGNRYKVLTHKTVITKITTPGCCLVERGKSRKPETNQKKHPNVLTNQSDIINTPSTACLSSLHRCPLMIYNWTLWYRLEDDGLPPKVIFSLSPSSVAWLWLLSTVKITVKIKTKMA